MSLHAWQHKYEIFEKSEKTKIFVLGIHNFPSSRRFITNLFVCHKNVQIIVIELSAQFEIVFFLGLHEARFFVVIVAESPVAELCKWRRWFISFIFNAKHLSAFCLFFFFFFFYLLLSLLLRPLNQYFLSVHQRAAHLSYVKIFHYRFAESPLHSLNSCVFLLSHLSVLLCKLITLVYKCSQAQKCTYNLRNMRNVECHYWSNT